jgi:DNA-binding protein H-NS
MDINLNTLSLKDLRDLQAQVTKAIATYQDRQKKAALVELEEMARAKGFTLAELTGVAVTRKRSIGSPKYANPADRSDTWSGRGRKPRWFIQALASGKKPDDLAI